MKFKDISIYFQSSCCNDGSAKPLSKRSRKMDPVQFFKQLPSNVDLHAATITIGNIKYGSLSSYEQYLAMKKAIKRTYRYHGNTKYLFFFEYQKNGQLHGHGIIYNGYQRKFVDGMIHFGQRNAHDSSYQLIKKKLFYLDYIQKEKEKMKKYIPIHNILLKDL